jgi:uncharacterized protein YecA (UPF0149 family)
LPERIESPREQQVMQSHNPSVSAGTTSTVPIAHSAPCPPNHDHSPSVSAGAPVSASIARCAPCPCGSGNKYKRCCGAASGGKFTPSAGPQGVAA